VAQGAARYAAAVAPSDWPIAGAELGVQTSSSDDDTPSELPELGSVGSVTGDVLGWVGLAMTSGVLGNATYDHLVSILQRKPNDHGSTVLDRARAIEVARLSLRTYLSDWGLHHIDPSSVPVSADAAPNRHGTWRISFMLPHRSIKIDIPSGLNLEDEVRVCDTAAADVSVARILVDLNPRSNKALARHAELGGESKSAIVNRAIVLYDTLSSVVETHGAEIVLRYPDGTSEKVSFI